MERCLIRQNSETFDILRTFQSSVVAKLSDLKNTLVFWPTLYTDSSVGSQSVTCLRELKLRCTVAVYLMCPVVLLTYGQTYLGSGLGFWVSEH